MNEIVELVDLIKDTVAVNSSNQVLETQLKDDTENFDMIVKLTEDARRRRQRRIDAGEETARRRESGTQKVPTVAGPTPLGWITCWMAVVGVAPEIQMHGGWLNAL